LGKAWHSLCRNICHSCCGALSKRLTLHWNVHRTMVTMIA